MKTELTDLKGAFATISLICELVKQVSYEDGKPTESAVYCFNRINFNFLSVYRCNKRKNSALPIRALSISLLFYNRYYFQVLILSKSTAQ